MNFIDPQLRPVLDKDNVIVQPSGGQGGIGTDSIGNGLYRVTLPRRHQGRRGPVRQHHRLSKTPSRAKTPKRGDGIPSPRFLPSIPLGSPSGRAVTEGD